MKKKSNARLNSTMSASSALLLLSVHRFCLGHGCLYFQLQWISIIVSAFECWSVKEGEGGGRCRSYADFGVIRTAGGRKVSHAMDLS